MSTTPLGGLVNWDRLSLVLAGQIVKAQEGEEDMQILTLTADPRVTPTLAALGQQGVYDGHLFVHLTAANDIQWLDLTSVAEPVTAAPTVDPGLARPVGSIAVLKSPGDPGGGYWWLKLGSGDKEWIDFHQLLNLVNLNEGPASPQGLIKTAFADFGFAAFADGGQGGDQGSKLVLQMGAYPPLGFHRWVGFRLVRRTPFAEPAAGAIYASIGDGSGSGAGALCAGGRVDLGITPGIALLFDGGGQLDPATWTADIYVQLQVTGPATIADLTAGALHVEMLYA